MFDKLLEKAYLDTIKLAIITVWEEKKAHLFCLLLFIVLLKKDKKKEMLIGIWVL